MPSPMPPTDRPSPRWLGLLARVLLLVPLILVVWQNARFFQAHPLPTDTQHDWFVRLTGLIHQLQGAREVDLCHVGPLRPFPWTHPGDWLAEVQPGGRFYPLVGTCGENFWSCAPHSMVPSALLALLVPGQPVVAQFGVTLYLVLLLVALDGIGREVSGPWTGLVAACIAAGYPGLFGYSRVVEGYLPAAALSTAMVWCILLSRGFTRWLPSAAFAFLGFTALRSGEGLAEGVGVGLAVAGPFAVEAVTGIVRHRRWKLVRLAIGVLLVEGLLLVSTDLRWVFDGLRHIFLGFEESWMAATPASGQVPASTQRWIQWTAYLALAWGEYLRPLLVGWLGLGAVAFLVTRPGRWVSVGAWLAVPLVAYAMMTRQAMWYALPLLPPLAMVTACGLAGLPARWRAVRGGLLLAAASTGLFQLLWLGGLGVPGSAAWVRWLAEPGDGLRIRRTTLLAHDVREDPALVERIRSFQAWADDALPRDGLTLVALLTDCPSPTYASHAFEYLVELHRPDLEIVHVDGACGRGVPASAYRVLVRMGSGFPKPTVLDPGGGITPPRASCGQPNTILAPIAAGFEAQGLVPVDGLPYAWWVCTGSDPCP